MKTKRVLTLALGFVLLLALSACTRHDVGTPSPVGPSSYTVLLKLSASPNVLAGGSDRQSSTVSVSLKRFDGTPLAGRTVHFAIRDVNYNRVNIGFFEGLTCCLSKVTDANGDITFLYYGPTNSEISAGWSIFIWGVVALEDNEFIDEFTKINIVRYP
jgi:hypothetical protein